MRSGTREAATNLLLPYERKSTGTLVAAFPTTQRRKIKGCPARLLNPEAPQHFPKQVYSFLSLALGGFSVFELDLHLHSFLWEQAFSATSLFVFRRLSGPDQWFTSNYDPILPWLSQSSYALKD